MEYIVVFCTVPDQEKAASIAGALVNDKLAACVNIIGGLRSIYFWNGEICDDPEVLLVIKTRADRFEELRDRIVELHPYDTPEVISLPITAGYPPYLKWIDGCLK